MNDGWDMRSALVCLLRALMHPELDSELDQDILELEEVRPSINVRKSAPSTSTALPVI